MFKFTQVRCFKVKQFISWNSSGFTALLFYGFLYPLCLKLYVSYKQVFRCWSLWFTDGIMRLTRTRFTCMVINKSYTYRWCIHCFLILFVDGSFCLITVCIVHRSLQSVCMNCLCCRCATPVLTVLSTRLEGVSEWVSVHVCCM
jgi:hypothetical protein